MTIKINWIPVVIVLAILILPWIPFVYEHFHHVAPVVKQIPATIKQTAPAVKPAIIHHANDFCTAVKSFVKQYGMDYFNQAHWPSAGLKARAMACLK